MRDWLMYAEQLEVHMDAGGEIGPNNVRDLIEAVRELWRPDLETFAKVRNTLNSEAK